MMVNYLQQNTFEGFTFFVVESIDSNIKLRSLYNNKVYDLVKADKLLFTNIAEDCNISEGTMLVGMLKNDEKVSIFLDDSGESYTSILINHSIGDNVYIGDLLYRYKRFKKYMKSFLKNDETYKKKKDNNEIDLYITCYKGGSEKYNFEYEVTAVMNMLKTAYDDMFNVMLNDIC